MKIKLSLFALVVFLASCEVRSYDEISLPEYDGALEWTRLTKKAQWSNRFDHQAVVFQNKVWVIGGYNPGGLANDSYLEDVWYSEDGENWEQATENAPFLGRRGHQVVSFNDGSGEAMFLIGGFTVDENSGKRSYRNDVWKSDDGVAWNEIKINDSTGINDSINWHARSNHQCLVASQLGETYIYLLGGQVQITDRSATFATKYYDDVWRSRDGISWERIFNNEYGIRSEFAAVVDDNNNLYIQGGVHGTAFETNDQSSHPSPEWQNLWISSDGESWTNSSMIEMVPEGHLFRSDHEMLWYADRIWTLPGKTNSNEHYHFTQDRYFQIWTHNPDNNGWAIDSEGTAIDARHGYAAVVFNEQILVLGGYTNRKGQDNDVWSAKL